MEKFNATLLIGKELEEARALAQEHGYEVREGSVDGKPRMLIQNIRMNRITVGTHNGFVIGIMGIG